MVPTAEDAIELLTDPARRAGTPQSGFGRVRGQEIITELRENGAETEQDAHTLVKEALATLGGMDRSNWRQSTGHRAGGPPRREYVYDFRVPMAKFRRA